MRFKDFLLEIGNNPIELKVTRDTEKSYRAKAIFGDREIEFRFNKDIGFNDTKADKIKNKWFLTFVELGEHHKNGETLNATGKGNEIAIFSTVKRFLDDSIAKFNPNVIYFEADKTKNDSRASLYKRFGKRPPPGYKFRTINSDNSSDINAYIKNEFYDKI